MGTSQQKSLHLIICLTRSLMSMLLGKRVDLGRANTESYLHICHMATFPTTAHQRSHHTQLKITAGMLNAGRL